MNFLQRTVPSRREDAGGLALITWALFGNDEDGIFGERALVPGFGPAYPQTFGQFLRWWTRNPCHNLMFHVLVWRRQDGSGFVVLEGPAPWCLLYWERPVTRNWARLEGSAILLRAIPFILSVRVGGFESYVGWRERGNPGARGFLLWLILAGAAASLRRAAEDYVRRGDSDRGGRPRLFRVYFRPVAGARTLSFAFNRDGPQP
jgi:hypothetical protein